LLGKSSQADYTIYVFNIIAVTTVFITYIQLSKLVKKMKTNIQKNQYKKNLETMNYIKNNNFFLIKKNKNKKKNYKKKKKKKKKKK
jgi:collagenase-like PrtC family protease